MATSNNDLQLRAFFYIDRMQAQYAAYFGTVTSGDIPVAGMAQLYVEMAPGNEVFRIVDMALKATDVKPGIQIVEREFGVLEVHSESQESVREAGRVILVRLGKRAVVDRKSTRLSSRHSRATRMPACAQQKN